MGVGKTVYKGEVETGVFAWFLCCQRQIVAAPCGSGAAFMALKLPQIDDSEL
jgi:hypothetical protein